MDNIRILALFVTVYLCKICSTYTMRSSASDLDDFLVNLLSTSLHSRREAACTTMNVGGLLTSPNYPSDYPSNSDICFTLKAMNGKVPELTFTAFDLEQSSGCRKDYIELTMGSRSRKLCGSSLPDPMVGNRQEMTVRFVSNGSDNKGGFQIMFMSVDQEEAEARLAINTNVCGISTNQYNMPRSYKAYSPLNSFLSDLQRRIVGGEETEELQWPWIASLRRGDSLWNRAHKCGVNIISENWLLTAAHCLVDEEKKPYATDKFSVVTGAHSLLSGTADTLSYQVDRFVIHSRFGTPKGFSHDIALVRVTTPIKLDGSRLPICLPRSSDVDPQPGDECITIGWGATTENSRYKPGDEHTLQQVTLPILDRNLCDTWWHKYGGLDDTMMCAGYEEGGVGTCEGDSGGPLLCQSSEGDRPWVLYGLVSWGDVPCVQEKKPAVYTRVTMYSSWITDNTDGEVTLT